MQVTKQARQTIGVKVGNIQIGGGAPIVIQSMTNTDTADVLGTAKQIYELYEAGSELVRITVNNDEAAKAVPHIFDHLVKMGWENPLIIGDFHYNGHQLLTDHPDCAARLAKYRINPGNVGFKAKQDLNFTTMIEVALKYDKAVRIGVNWGSLDQALAQKLMDENLKRANPLSNESVTCEAMIQSAIQSAEAAERLGMNPNRLVISCKTSRAPALINLYRDLSKRCQYALHLGLTEAGMGSKGVAATAAAFGVLLLDGIGDTIRSSLTPAPGGDRREEVRVSQEIVQALELRSFVPAVTACPGCGRTTSTVFQSLAQDVQQHIRMNMPRWKKDYPGVETLNIAVMGCIVNGPGESKHADIGISLPGTGETPTCPVFVDGQKTVTLRGPQVPQDFIELVDTYIQKRFGAA